MKNVVVDFLKFTNWRKFALSDFMHYLNRKGIAVSEKDASHMLFFSDAVEPTEDGMWRKRK